MNTRIAPFLIIATIAILAGTQSRAQAQDFVLYGATTGGSIYEVDPVAKTSAQVASFGSNINGLAWVPTQERLYFSRSINANGDGGLYYWDRNTGTFSNELLTTAQLLGDMDNGSYYNGGIWYVDGNGATDTLYRIDVNTLAISSFSNFDGTARTYFDFGDMVITEAGQAYGYSSDDNGATTFFNFSLASGAPGGYSQTSAAGNYQLGINLNDSVLYGTGGINVGTGNWFTVNPSTGATTAIDNFTTPAFTDLSGRGALRAAVVPEANTATLLGLVLPMIGAVAVARRKKRA